MFEDNVEFTIENNKERCYACKFYIWEDSGYGYCRRYPPKVVKTVRWGKRKYKISYQIVEWCRRACGEFLPKEVKK